MQRGETGDGYQYLRNRARGEDVTVYFHQLAALRAGHSVSDVFAGDTEVHHRWPILEYNVPANVDVVDVDTHADAHPDLPDGRQPVAITDGGNGGDA